MPNLLNCMYVQLDINNQGLIQDYQLLVLHDQEGEIRHVPVV